MQSLAVSGYSATAVDAVLHAPNQSIAFRYDLLDKNNNFKSALKTVTGAHVANNALAQIKRTANFTIKDDGTINFLSDRIKPWVRIKMPDGGYAEFPQGVFLLSTPPQQTDNNLVVTRNVDGYDQLQILVDDKVTSRYTITAGTNYITATQTLLTSAGITLTNLVATTKTLPADQDWDPSTPKLQIINDLLGAINYRSLYFDENGYAVAIPYQSPSVRPAEYTYIDDSNSVLLPQFQRSLDLFAVPNQWTLVVSETDRPNLVSTYTNSNANSLTSTVSRGRTIVNYRQVNAADQATLDAMAQRIAFEASQVYEEVTFYTPIMPMHSDSDVYNLTFSALGISDKYSEHSWEFDLSTGSQMKHVARRVVNV